jgi:asparagine synthase (glutamine-hydrolysing)
LCGIAGFTTLNWRPEPERIRDATATLTHRGPDQQDTFRSPACSLGATRLKILDLHAGDQPIYSPDGDTVIVFNGEIYNHLDIRRELEALGHSFTTHCDTETVLHAFMQWDTDCFARLRGMFAIALWSKSGQRLVLARDRLGIKPLYFAHREGDLLFGSELKAILIHPEVERRISLDGLDCYLALNYVPCPWTLVDGIEKLPPGRWLSFHNGDITTAAYWQLPAINSAENPSPQISLEDAKSQLDALLKESVKEQLMSDVPLGFWLSGGVDSSTILHYAAQATTERLHTFSISFAGRSFDESPYIQEVAQRYNTIHEQLDLAPDLDLAGAIEQFSYFSDEPSADAGALPVWFLSKMCRQQTTVIFSGEGADEIFGGYLTYKANAIAARVRHLPAASRRLALRALAHWPASDEKISFEYKLKRLLEGSLLSPGRAHTFWNGSFSDSEKSALLRIPLPPALDDILAPLNASIPGDGLSPYLEFDQQYFLPDDILVKSDRMSMAHSIEVRPVFLDHRIVEFAATLPASLKIHGGRQKFVLKELMKSKLPDSVLNRSKIGFDIPAHEWFRGPLLSLLTDTLDATEQQYADLFNFPALREMLRQHLDRRINIGYHLWGMMILLLWMKRWNIQTSASSTAAGTAHQALATSVLS